MRLLTLLAPLCLTACAKDLTGRARVVGPNEAHSREMHRERIAVRVVGDEGEIGGFTFG